MCDLEPDADGSAGSAGTGEKGPLLAGPQNMEDFWAWPGRMISDIENSGYCAVFMEALVSKLHQGVIVSTDFSGMGAREMALRALVGELKSWGVDMESIGRLISWICAGTFLSRDWVWQHQAHLGQPLRHRYARHLPVVQGGPS